MAKREMKKGSPEYAAFVAVWDFWKQYGTPEDDERYWQEMLDDGSQVALNDKYKECWDLSSEFVKGIMNVLDARSKSNRRFGDISHGYDILLSEMDMAAKKQSRMRERIKELEAENEELKKRIGV